MYIKILVSSYIYFLKSCLRFNQQLLKSPENLITRKDISTHIVSFYSRRDEATFEDIKNNTNVIIIDVREPSELRKTGQIPGSINIPLGELEKVLNSMTPNDFKKIYGHKKPNETSSLIFSCRSGNRAGKAMEIALKLGFKNARKYAGSWKDWEKRTRK